MPVSNQRPPACKAGRKVEPEGVGNRTVEGKATPSPLYSARPKCPCFPVDSGRFGHSFRSCANEESSLGATRGVAAAGPSEHILVNRAEAGTGKVPASADSSAT